MIEKNLSNSDQFNLHYEVFKPAQFDKTLVFVHGFGGSLKALEPLAQHFIEKNYQVINVDLRAHGQSSRPVHYSQYKLGAFAEDLVSILLQEKAKNVTLIGHCFGGLVSLLVTTKQPKLVKSLVLINASYQAPHLARLAYRYMPMKSAVNSLLRMSPTLYLKSYPVYSRYQNSGDFNLKRISSDILHTSLKSYLYTAQKIAQVDFMPYLAQITQAVLIIHGEKDRVFPLNIAKQLKKGLVNAKLRVIKNANHLTVLNNKQQILKIIDQQLQEKFL